MPVKNVMSQNLITIEEEASMMKASKLMKDHKIHHLPVLSKGRLVGIISDRDLKEAQPSKATTLDIHELYYLLDKVSVKSLMSPNLFTIRPEATLEKAAAIMQREDISALPVVNQEGALAGIITKGDVFRAFVLISGIYQGPLAMGFELADETGSIQKVAAVIRAHGGRIVSILTAYERVPEGFRQVFIRAKGVKDEKALLKALESTFHVLYYMQEKMD
jgi:acetoin utilization protein AcuB